MDTKTFKRNALIMTGALAFGVASAMALKGLIASMPLDDKSKPDKLQVAPESQEPQELVLPTLRLNM